MLVAYFFVAQNYNAGKLAYTASGIVCSDIPPTDNNFYKEITEKIADKLNWLPSNLLITQLNKV
jgi:DNA-binding LacI/PurR family transcriptional regulator